MRFQSITSWSALRIGVMSICLAWVTLPACTEPTAFSPVAPTSAPTPAAIRVATPTAADVSTQAHGLLMPTPTPEIHAYGPPETAFVPASLESSVYLVPIIARASLLRGEPTTEPIASSPGVAPTYKAVHQFRFRVVEYMRGEGAAEITVRHRSNDAYLTQAEALEVARRSFASRNSAWDDREAILFLVGENESNFRFLDWVWGEFQYTVDTLNRSWLPSAQAPGVTGQSSASRSYLTGEESDSIGGATGNSEGSFSVLLTDLRAAIASADKEMKAGERIEGYDRCIRARFEIEHYYRAEEFALGRTWTPRERVWRISSGQPTGTQIRRQELGSEEALRFGVGYGMFWLAGLDKDLYSASIYDADNDYSNGYSMLIETSRPLPTGTYRFSSHSQRAEFVPCNYIPAKAYVLHVVTVTAPEGTVHEAFFDPVTIGSAIGADGANGALKPAAFTVNGTSIMLQSLKWRNSGIITLTLSPNASLSGLALDFIALDGTVALTLPASAAKTDSAAGTVTWSSAVAPWMAGDKLMLRIRNAAATPRPTPTATATPTATPTPAPPPGPVSGQ